jgi:hypothetical protein
MEFYSDIKKNEIMFFTGKWMKLENIMLSKLTQVQNIKSYIFSFICGGYNYKINVHINIYMTIYIYREREIE